MGDFIGLDGPQESLIMKRRHHVDACLEFEGHQDAIYLAVGMVEREKPHPGLSGSLGGIIRLVLVPHEDDLLHIGDDGRVRDGNTFRETRRPGRRSS